MRSVRSTRARRGFTILEVMVAVAILALITVAIYQFVSVVLSSARYAQEVAGDSADTGGLNRFLQDQFLNLPLKVPGAAQTLAGKTARGAGGRADALSWVVLPGASILARRAEGLYIATLELLPGTKGGQPPALGLSRAKFDPDNPAAAPVSSSIRLLPGVSSVEITYYDARINNWVDEWQDAATLPDLIRFRLFFTSGGSEHEVVVKLPPKSGRT